MSIKKKLEFNQSEHKREEDGILEVGNILIDAQNELSKLKVKCEPKDLIQGNFLDEFHNHHRKAHNQQKEGFVKMLSYEKYIEMLEFDVTELEKLEEIYNARAFSQREFYAYNTKFYQYCKNNASRNPSLKEYLDDAPKKVSFKPVDLLVFKNGNIEVNLDTELFTTYASNDKQLEMMNDIKQFVKLGKKMDLAYKDVYTPIKHYLYDESNLFHGHQTGKQGLTRDLNEVNFNYNKILTIQ
ncbi:hypothetical protein RBU60_06045 [Mesonia sp. MT50]|uniref:Uncharacterized protein n=1 Tax=Mesonia profundi TaxID=3070998 RepID=A0ABU1A097_9FLAO|nr:hypothetical protein [Mesonia profundi]MDQ7917130.1 hypothetical protein [Mesonia profundi]